MRGGGLKGDTKQLHTQRSPERGEKGNAPTGDGESSCPQTRSQPVKGGRGSNREEENDNLISFERERISPGEEEWLKVSSGGRGGE